MQYIFFDTNTLSEEMVKKYYPMLTEHKRKKIADEPDPHARAVYFCSEICARICLSREFEAPAFSFSLLINPNGAIILPVPLTNTRAEWECAASIRSSLQKRSRYVLTGSCVIFSLIPSIHLPISSTEKTATKARFVRDLLCIRR